jgi:hypothetical protein
MDPHSQFRCTRPRLAAIARTAAMGTFEARAPRGIRVKNTTPARACSHHLPLITRHRFLIGCSAIKNRCKLLNVKGGCHF